jgi:hypothetical protein
MDTTAGMQSLFPDLAPIELTPDAVEPVIDGPLRTERDMLEVHLISSRGRILSQEMLCQEHLDMEQRLAVTGLSMVEVEVLPLPSEGAR